MVVLLAPPEDDHTYYAGEVITGEAFAWDPDDVHPTTCALDAEYPEDNGKGIAKVHFEIWKDGVGIVYQRDQTQKKYCAFTGNGPCQVFSIGTLTWPFWGGSADSGTYTLKASAYDGAHWSAYDEVTFEISLPTPSPTATPETPSPTPVTPSATPETPSPTPETPSPTPETASPTPETPSPTPS
jgi:cell division septation protein DedD